MDEHRPAHVLNKERATTGITAWRTSRSIRWLMWTNPTTAPVTPTVTTKVTLAARDIGLGWTCAHVVAAKRSTVDLYCRNLDFLSEIYSIPFEELFVYGDED